MEYNGKNIRTYEISVWTLQDSFITVLKFANLENKGQIEEGKIKLNVDGTQELSFRIPMYIDGKENPIWYNTLNGNIITNMRKVKVIFNKLTDDEQVFEFVIVKVEESHESDQLYCNVTCEGLAYHELGKRGYTISLNKDVYLIDYDKWEEEGHESELLNNIQYWMNKAFKDLDDWEYEIQVVYNFVPDSIIYEDDYVSEWKVDETWGKVIPNAVSVKQEKCRIVDIEQGSNLYNITQKIAETFGVYCKYVYKYDSSYHIIKKKVIFYNNFYSDESSFIDFTYPYSTSEIKRIEDGTDLVTKLYVKSIDDTNDELGQINIMDTEANKTKENYILNFDYLHQIGTINQEQYDAIEEYNGEMRKLNDKLITEWTAKTALENQKIELDAQFTIAKNGMDLATSNIQSAEKLKKNLTNDTGFITIDDKNPVSVAIIQDSSNTGFYYIPIRHLGVDPKTVHIYTTIDYTKAADGAYDKYDNYSTSRLRNKLVNWTPEFDEYNNLVKIKNFNINNVQNSNNESINFTTLYLVYRYAPSLYYDNVIKVWTEKYQKDSATKDELESKIEIIAEKIEQYEKAYAEDENSQKEKRARFENLMGPALREGYWQPENYSDRGSKYKETLNVYLDEMSASGQFNASFIWDENKLEGEQDSGYAVGVGQQKEYYSYIELNSNILNGITNEIDGIIKHLDDFSLVYQADYNTPSYTNLRSMKINSQMQFAFMKVYDEKDKKYTITPILLLTDTLNNSDEQWIKNFCLLGKIDYSDENNFIKTYVRHSDIVISKDNNLLKWYSDNNQNIFLVYPRIKIKSLLLKTSEDLLNVYYKNVLLKQYEDFTITSSMVTEGDEKGLVDGYYITLKPHVILKYGCSESAIKINYELSTAATSVYLDALQVSRENAFPKVSYSVNSNIYGAEFTHNAYNRLAQLIHINDTQLKFENVMGYISELDLNLDKPWEDSVTVQNYKNKFEDLFSTIVAQTEAMQATEPLLSGVKKVITINGDVQEEKIQDIIHRADLDYAFNNGNLTINEADGIWAVSDSGVVAIRGGGIFTATEKNGDGSWAWNTGITPEGISADLITTGQLDTNRINIYAGDNLRLQMNGDGLFAYMQPFGSRIDDIIEDIKNASGNNNFSRSGINGLFKTVNGELTYNDNIIIDNIISEKKQYVKFCQDGLFLIAENGTPYIKKELINNKYEYTYKTIENWSEIKRVEISWDGLILRNYDNEKVFYADAETGNLTLSGKIEAESGIIGGFTIEPKLLYYKEKDNRCIYIKGGSTGQGDVNNNYALWVGAINGGRTEEGTTETVPSAPFSIKYDGTLYAAEGQIGQWLFDPIHGGAFRSTSGAIELVPKQYTDDAVLKKAGIYLTSSEVIINTPSILINVGTNQESNYQEFYQHKRIDNTDDKSYYYINRKKDAETVTFSNYIGTVEGETTQYQLYKLEVVEDGMTVDYSNATPKYVLSNGDYQTVIGIDSENKITVSVPGTDMTSYIVYQSRTSTSDEFTIVESWRTRLQQWYENEYEAEPKLDITNFLNGTTKQNYTYSYLKIDETYDQTHSSNFGSVITRFQIADYYLPALTLTGDGISANYGTIGGFAINNNNLSGGRLDNSVIINSSFNSGTINNIDVNNYSRAFNDISINSNTLTFTRVDGTFQTITLPTSSGGNISHYEGGSSSGGSGSSSNWMHLSGGLLTLRTKDGSGGLAKWSYTSDKSLYDQRAAGTGYGQVVMYYENGTAAAGGYRYYWVGHNEYL